MKTLYEYFKDRLETGVSPEDERPSPIVLADFQRDGYLIAEEILEKYGGVILVDSVGFGNQLNGQTALFDLLLWQMIDLRLKAHI
jgi:hypothetical protein